MWWDWLILIFMIAVIGFQIDKYGKQTAKLQLQQLESLQRIEFQLKTIHDGIWKVALAVDPPKYYTERE